MSFIDDLVAAGNVIKKVATADDPMQALDELGEAACTDQSGSATCSKGNCALPADHGGKCSPVAPVAPPPSK